jgi:hypothetical protein
VVVEPLVAVDKVAAERKKCLRRAPGARTPST